MKQFNSKTRSVQTLLVLLAFLLGGISPAWADGKALPYSYGFEDGGSLGDGWTSVNASGGNSTYFGVTTDAKYSGTYGFRLSSWSATVSESNGQYIISPLLATSTSGIDVSFYYKNSSTTYSNFETFKVGYSTTTADVSAFTFGSEQKASSGSWELFSESYGSDVKYIAILYYSSSSKYHLYVDDILIKKTPTCITPSGLAALSITATGATLNWTAAYGQENWVLQYSTDNTFVSGVVEENVSTTSSKTLTGLTGGTTYYARVKADCGGGDESEWSDVISFTPGTLIINNVSTTTNNYVPIYGNYMDDHSRSQFIMPKASLTSLAGTQITKIVFYGTASNTAKFANKTFDVYLKEVDGTTISELSDWTSLEQVYSGNLTISDGKMTITLDEGFDYSGDKNLLIGVNQTDNDGDYTSTTWTGISATGASMGGYGTTISQRDFLPQTTFYFAPQTASVKKPKNLDDTATTTTTATLGWTNGGDETAWQIAYSTDTDFDPDTGGTKVAADANPFTLTGLTAATTYYAYVRAEKSGDYSGWSNKADFTTLSAVPVIELSATSHNFGMVSDADAQALTLTITNSGGAALTGLTVTPSAGFAVTDADGNALTATSIAASSTLTVKVKVNSVGQQDGTITIDGNEIEAKQVTVSGYKLDDTKILETFASASSVSRWTVASGWTFNASTGAYAGTSSRTMTSPKLSVAAGNVLALNVKLGWSGGSLIVEGLDADGNTVYNAVTYNSSNGGLNTSNYTLLTINDMPTTVAKVKLTGYYAYINVFNGFTYVNDPVLGIFSNEGCTTAQASPTTKNFGFATAAQNQLYYIKNTGNGQIDLTINQAEGFTAAVDDAALAEGEKATLTVTMTATEGLHEGAITVTAKNHDNDDVLGTFVINANGGITGTKNNVVLTAFPAGWQNNNWAINSGAARIWSSTPSDLITTTLRVTEGDKLLVEAKKYYNTDDSQLSYSYSANNGTTWSDAVSLTSQLTTDYKIVAISGIPAGDVLMKFTGTYAYIRQIYGFEAVSEPIMEFAAAGTTKNFGMISSNTTSDAYTITNSGTATLKDLSVTCDNSSFDIAITGNVEEIAAGGSATFTVTMNTTDMGEQTGIVTISGTGVADKTFNVKGYVADGTKIFTTFAALPDRWTNSGWTFNTSGATTTSSSSKLESPKIKITEGQKLAISAMQRYSGSSYYVTINGSSDNGATWTAYTKTLNNTQLNNTDYTVVELDDIPTTVNKLQLVGYYVYVNGLNGFTYDDNDPQFAMFSNSECTTAISEATVTNAWGFVNEDKTATYYIKNTGTGTMTLSKTDAPAGFTATLGKTSLGANESTSLVISMANDATNNEGYHAGDVVLTAKDNADNTLGTFTVTSSGVVVGSKTDINFTTLDAFPAGWESTNWSVTANTKAYTNSYSSGVLTTGTYTIAAGEKLAIEAKGNSSYTAPTLTYRYTTDNGVNWTNGTSTLTYSYSTTAYTVQAITDIPAAAAVKIEFTGQYVDIQRIYGYTAVLEPAMTLSPAATSYDFGMQTAAADYEITVTNSGTAAMENMTAALSGTDATDFEVALSVPDGSSATITEGKANIPVGQAIKVTATLKASTEYKTHNATLTISADDLADKVITLSGKTRDASKWYVDFAEGSIPTSFVESGSWSASSYYATTTSSTENSLITQPINLAAGEKIYFDAKNPYSGSLKVRYSVNGGISWSDYTDYTSQLNTSTFTTLTLDLENTDAVTAIVDFCGRYYIQLDNIYGGTLNNTAPMIKVTKSAAAVESGATEEFGSIMTETAATYTITNVGNGTLTITSVNKTGEATTNITSTSLTAGQSATLTITMPVASPYGAKSGAVTVATNLGDFVINYTATTLNPNALDEQFASGKPAGWYFGGYWKVSGEQAMQEDSGTAEDLITEQLAVAGTSDILTFQAARTSSTTAPTFKVYTSADRVNWNEVDLSSLTLTTSYQDVNISGLAAGDYYVKISGARVKVDNFLGWTKKNNTHDLYVTSTTFPTATQDGGAEISASATVTSLIAAETGVYAKLFVNGAAVVTADAQDITLNGSKTFSMNYSLPTAPGTYKAQIKVYYSDDTEACASAENDVKVYYVLDESIEPTSITAGTYDVKLTRSFVAEGGWNTICLPFEVPVSTFNGTTVDAVAYKFTGYDGGSNVLSFTKVETTLEAGKPYVIYTPAGVGGSFTLTNCEFDATTPGSDSFAPINFLGTYTPIAAGSMTGNWGVTPAGKIQKAGSGASIKGFRAYFTGLAGAPSLSFEDMTTGIKTVISADELNMDGEVYNLNGQKVQNAHKGLYIKNGKKYMVK